MDGLMENPIKMDDLGYHYFRKHPDFLIIPEIMVPCHAIVPLSLATTTVPSRFPPPSATHNTSFHLSQMLLLGNIYPP